MPATTTSDARECLTPEAYDDLREYLDASGKWSDTPWPCVLFLVDDGPSGRGPVETARRKRELRAAWWTRLTAPRREAHADPEADDQLETCPCVRGRCQVLFCRWCDGSGVVIDGRVDPDSDYAGSLTVWAQREATPEQVAAEMAYRATQPDVFWHGEPGCRKRGELPADLVSERLGVTIGNGYRLVPATSRALMVPLLLARAPLLELLHQPRNTP